MNRDVLLLALVALAVGLLTQTAYDIRRIARGVSKDNEAVDRYVDIGVDLKVVRADDNGEEYIPGARRMSIVREYSLGGVLDTKANPPRILEGEAGWSKNPQTWYCSEDQERIILHDDTEPAGKLALGGMGAGKTTAGIIWLYLRWLENIGTRKEIGITAPTETRLSLVLNELFRMWPSHWFSFNSENKIATLADGFRLRGVSTHRQSASAGSRIQAFNWIGLLSDELQDSIAEFDHMMARLRSKEDGRAKWLAPSTAKDLSEWRDLKGKMIASGDWTLHQLLGPSSPFISPDHWGRMKRAMTDRDYRRLVLAEDLPPESRVYFSWDRKENLRPVPLVGARKITSIVLKAKTGDSRHSLLIGHDPGTAKAASIFLDAYDVRGDVCWWVRAELFTLHKSSEQHALEVLDIARKRFGVNVRADGERAHVRAQPVGQAEDRPDLDIYRIWKRVGFDIKAAQYKKDGTGTGQIKKDSRIEMVNRLLCDAAGRRRLFVDMDEQGRPVAPKLVEAFETMERDHRGRAEHEEKDEKDPTDAPCALGYALHPFERESSTALRADIKKGIG